MVSSPPRTEPVATIVNGKAPRPSSSTSTPKARSESMVVAIGRRRAPSSPSNVIRPAASAAKGGTNLITVPARPQSMVVSTRPSASASKLTSSSPPAPVAKPKPSDFRASIISEESRDSSGSTSVEDEPDRAARAAKINSRLVSDFDPGNATVAAIGPAATGAGQSSCLLE